MSKRRKAQTGGTRTNTLLSMSNLKEFTVNEGDQVQKDLKQLQAMEEAAEKHAQSKSGKRDRNKYPNNQLDKQLNFDKYFVEKARERK